jgi:hypothetical protein
VRAGFPLDLVRQASQGEVESWLQVIREAAPKGGRPEPVKKVSRRFLEQQRQGRK